jgi:putative pyruvate formate lyase activating enzyme
MRFEYLIRPDALLALEDPLVRKSLPRYVKIVKDELPAKFQIAKRIAFDFDESLSEKQLWLEHEKLMKKFYEVQEAIDKGELSLKDLGIPKFSLLDLKIMLTREILKSCQLCERKCGVNRLEGEKGFCKALTEWKIFGAHHHYGEEGELVPSGTIFQAACTMRCVYCQNAPESVSPELGVKWSVEEVARWIGKMKKEGARNINWVGGSPTSWLLNILEALKLTNANIAQVWNSNSYYSEKTAKILDGVIDLYLLDFRYFNEECAKILSSAPNYPEAARRNHLIAKKVGELLIRVLVIPTHIECDAKPIVKWIKENLGEFTRVNILPQYRPCWEAFNYRGIDRPLTHEEWLSVIEYAKRIGLKNLVMS